MYIHLYLIPLSPSPNIFTMVGGNVVHTAKSSAPCLLDSWRTLFTPPPPPLQGPSIGIKKLSRK